jgi:hypothetical protein
MTDGESRTTLAASLSSVRARGGEGSTLPCHPVKVHIKDLVYFNSIKIKQIVRSILNVRCTKHFVMYKNLTKD